MCYLYTIKNKNIKTDDLTFNDTLYQICTQNRPIVLSKNEFYCQDQLNNHQKKLIEMLTELTEKETSLVAYTKESSWSL